MLNEVRALLGSTATQESFLRTIDRREAKSLHDRARAFQNEFEPHQWGPVRGMTQGQAETCNVAVREEWLCALQISA